MPSSMLIRLRPLLLCVMWLTQGPAYAFDVTIGLEQFQYASDPTYDYQVNRYTNVIPTLRAQNGFFGGRLTTKADVTAIIPLNDEGEFHVFSQDLYVRHMAPFMDGGIRAFTFGRSLRLWSQLDNDWGLGLWQPLFRYDYLSPTPMGLTGLFAEGMWSDFQIVFFVSPFHLPDQQPRFVVDNGVIKSSNRWFRAPISTIEFSAGESQVFYDVRKPSVRDVVLNHAVGLSVLTGDTNDGLWFRAAVADKPMNQFHLGIEKEGIILLDENGNLRPPVYPIVVRHRLYTVESGFSWDDRNMFYVAATVERFEDPSLPEGWDETKLVDASYYGAGMRMSLDRIGLRRTLLTANFVARQELEGENSTLIEGEIEASTQRLGFKQLAQVGLNFPLSQRYVNRWAGEMKYTYSFSDQGEWISARINYAPNRNLVWHLGGDLLGAPDEVKGERSFISNYRNNDRITGGLTYVF